MTFAGAANNKRSCIRVVPGGQAEKILCATRMPDSQKLVQIVFTSIALPAVWVELLGPARTPQGHHSQLFRSVLHARSRCQNLPLLHVPEAQLQEGTAIARICCGGGLQRF